jgi:tetratricopeptide (TPR) repeat protein
MAFERGEQDLAANRLDEAASAYRQAIAARPNYADALNGLGSVLFKQGQKDEAIAQFKAAIDADPNFKLAYFNLGYAARKSGDFANAAKAYEKYIQLDPNDPDGYYGLGESYRQLGNATNAVKAYEQFIAKETRPSEQRWVDKAKEQIAALKPGAENFSMVGRPAVVPGGAPDPLRRATSSRAGGASPDSQESLAVHHIAEGDRLMEENKYRLASFAYQDAVNSDPSNIEGLFKLANSEAVLGYYTHAVVAWSKVMQLTNDAVIRKSAEENIGRAQKKMTDVSVRTLQLSGPPTPLAAPDPARGQARAAYERGVKQINGQDYAGALQSLSQAIELQPNLAPAYTARGSANMGMQRYPEAVSDYQSALKVDGNLATPLYGLGEALQAMGRAADARRYYEKYAASAAVDARPDLQREARQKADKLR